MKITPIDAAAGDAFGLPVAIFGDTIVIGASRDDDAGNSSGSAYVFTRNGTWTQQAKLTALDAAAGDEFGVSLAVADGTIVVAAPANDYAGAAYVFEKPTSVWTDATETQKLQPNNTFPNQFFGRSAEISGNSIVISAYEGGAGAAYVFGPDLEPPNTYITGSLSERSIPPATSTRLRRHSRGPFLHRCKRSRI